MVMAHNSRTLVEAPKSLEVNDLLKKAMGFPFWDKTAPIPTPEASVSTMKGFVKSGKAKTEAIDRACLRLSKAA